MKMKQRYIFLIVGIAATCLQAGDSGAFYSYRRPTEKAAPVEVSWKDIGWFTVDEGTILLTDTARREIEKKIDVSGVQHFFTRKILTSFPLERDLSRHWVHDISISRLEGISTISFGRSISFHEGYVMRKLFDPIKGYIMMPDDHDGCAAVLDFLIHDTHQVAQNTKIIFALYKQIFSSCARPDRHAVGWRVLALSEIAAEVRAILSMRKKDRKSKREAREDIFVFSQTTSAASPDSSNVEKPKLFTDTFMRDTPASSPSSSPESVSAGSPYSERFALIKARVIDDTRRPRGPQRLTTRDERKRVARKNMQQWALEDQKRR